MRWVRTTGGPLMLLPKTSLKTWSGCEVPTDGRVIDAEFRWNGPGSTATDYDRACDVRAYAATIAVGRHRAVVFGDESMQAAWWPLKRGGVLVRWFAAPSEEAVELALRGLPAAVFKGAARFSWAVPRTALVLVDTSLPGREALADPGTLPVKLVAGEYRVETAPWSPDGSTRLLLHRFTPKPKRGRPASRSRPRRSRAQRAGARRGRR